MGFDKDCIVDIHSLRGEYFCPVCHTLVNPNEALQSQCTHLYCSRCLTYVVRTTNVCPYDGYLVTEEDSKPLVESDKALAERLDKTLVRCLYHRSGCSWQGPLCHCNSHCFGCYFRNSPVVCNRCGMQLAHYQVQEHAQTCVVPSPQAQTSSQLVAQALQAPVTQAATAPPSAHNANPEVQANTSADWTPSERWFPQQLQQYYRQYPASVPNWQSYQQYYPYQQQTAQQLHQHAPLVGGQTQLYAQNSAATQRHYQPVQKVQCQIQENTRPQIAQALQAPVPQAATAPPSPHYANPEVQANTSADWTPSEQWYPRLLQQYYRQHPASVPNWQSYLQYNPYQQQTAQQLDQHAPLVGGQTQLYAQNSAPTQPHCQPVQQVQCQIQENAQPQIQNMAQNNIQERLMKLAEALKKEQHQLHRHIVDLQKKHDDIQLLELETGKLGGALGILRAYVEGGNVEAKKKIETLEENLKDKDETIEYLEGINQALLVKERKSNDELQNARKELINLVSYWPPTLQNSIGVKRMGDIDYKTIVSAAMKIYPYAEVHDKAEEFFTQFRAKIMNPDWYPFKLIRMVGEDRQEEVIDKGDEYLRAVKREWDNELYDAVLTAVAEMNEYNPSGRFFVDELWNYEEGRKATLTEGVKFIGDF